MTTQSGFTLARRLRAGETVFTAWCGLAAPIVAETIAREGFSAVTLDQQHGLYDMASTAAAIAGIRMAGSAPIVRVPLGDFAVVSRVLDFGAEAVIAPMINTMEDARAFVAAAKYPPAGERSWGPHRATILAGMPDQKVYLREANALTLTFAMIETRAALANMDAIAATRGHRCAVRRPVRPFHRADRRQDTRSAFASGGSGAGKSAGGREKSGKNRRPLLRQCRARG